MDVRVSPPENPDQIWQSLTIEEMQNLMHFYLSSRDKPWQNSGGSGIHDLPAEIIKVIGSFFSRDPQSWHNFAISCKVIKRILGNYYDVADRNFMAPWVDRLLNRCNNLKGNSLFVRNRRVFDEKCRYIEIAYRVPKGKENTSTAKIDKYTGLILSPTNDHPRGYVTDLQPEEYFGKHGHLLYINDMKANFPGFKDRSVIMKKEWKEGTADLKTKGSREKRKMYSDVWDEGPRRKKVLAPKKYYVL